MPNTDQYTHRREQSPEYILKSLIKHNINEHPVNEIHLYWILYLLWMDSKEWPFWRHKATKWWQFGVRHKGDNPLLAIGKPSIFFYFLCFWNKSIIAWLLFSAAQSEAVLPNNLGVTSGWLPARSFLAMSRLLLMAAQMRAVEPLLSLMCRRKVWKHWWIDTWDTNTSHYQLEILKLFTGL